MHARKNSYHLLQLIIFNTVAHHFHHCHHCHHFHHFHHFADDCQCLNNLVENSIEADYLALYSISYISIAISRRALTLDYECWGYCVCKELTWPKLARRAEKMVLEVPCNTAVYASQQIAQNDVNDLSTIALLAHTAYKSPRVHAVCV